MEKKKIYWQDRFGWFGYQDWIKKVENDKVQSALEKITGQSDQPSIAFLILDGVEHKAEVLRTLDSLQQAPDAAVVLCLPRGFQHPQAGWLVDLLKKDNRLVALEMEPACPHEGWIQHLDQIPGEWILPLRAGDRMAPFWMKMFTSYAGAHPGAGLIYWDEDSLDERGRRSRPFFKPDWSPELLISVNYLETAAFRKSRLQDYIETKPACQAGWIFNFAHALDVVGHIPFVLQHRRTRVSDVGQHAKKVTLFLQDQGFQNVETVIQHGHLRVRWASEKPMVSVVIPTKNNLLYLRRCVSSLIEKTDYPGYEILLMDDHSTDPDVLDYYEALKSAYPFVRVFKNEGPFNYSQVNNRGARLSKGNLLLFLNNDVEIIHADWLEEMVRWTLAPGVGITGAKLVYPDQTIQHAGIVIGMTGHASHVFAGKPPTLEAWYVSPDDYRNVSAVTGACMMTRREVFDYIGGFHEDLGLVFNDVEICLRALRQGFRVVYTPAACLIHYEGRSRARYIPPADIRLGAAILSGDIRDGDPYYNPNLSLSVNWPSLGRRNEPDACARLERIVAYKG